MPSLDEHQKKQRKLQASNKDTSKRLNMTDRKLLLNYAMHNSEPVDDCFKQIAVKRHKFAKDYLANFKKHVSASELKTLFKYEMITIVQQSYFADIKSGWSAYVNVVKSDNEIREQLAKDIAVYRKRYKSKLTQSEIIYKKFGGLPRISMSGGGPMSQNSPVPLTDNILLLAKTIKTLESECFDAVRRHEKDFEAALRLCKTYRDACDLWKPFETLHSQIQPISNNQQIRAISPDVYSRISKTKLVKENAA